MSNSNWDPINVSVDFLIYFIVVRLECVFLYHKPIYLVTHSNDNAHFSA